MLATKTYITASSLFTPLGLGIKRNWEQMALGNSAIHLVNREDISLKNFFASSFQQNEFENLKAKLEGKNLTKLEKMLTTTISDIEDQTILPLSHKKTIFVYSTTKGNIDLLSVNKNDSRLSLHSMGRAVTAHFQNPNEPVVVSNACISGISALILGKNILDEGQFDQVIVCGGDLLSEFTVAGFNCLHAISPFPCKPFDKERMGLSPGEGCAVAVLTKQKSLSEKGIFISGSATSNDANHISGPSRTGDGLHIAIEKAIKMAKTDKSNIGFINSHGTATLYNDESEGLALTLSGLQNVPVNSLKGYFGHTFGAAGLIEAVLVTESIKRSEIIGSHGYNEHGISVPLNVQKKAGPAEIKNCLKTASGFGGCNAAIIISADE